MSETRRAALTLLRSALFFVHLLRDLARAGLVGEQRNALVIYVVASSRLLPEPMALFVKGPSGIGKNYTVDRVLDFIPAGGVYKFTSSSERSWNYQKANLAHKLVYLKELNQRSGPVHPLRLLLSERELTYSVTVREGKQNVVRDVITKGPVAAISTSTSDRVEVDDETRHLSIWLDRSREQTQRVVYGTIERELEKAAVLTSSERAVWWEAQRLLKGRAAFPVKFPNWLRDVGNSIQTDNLWARRYFPAFLRAIKTIVLIRSFRWSRSELEKFGHIPVRFSDFAIATLIFAPVFGESLRRADDVDLEVRQIIAVLSETKGGEPVQASELALHLKIPVDKAYSMIRSAESAGTIKRTNHGARFNRKAYMPSVGKGFLQDPETIFHALMTGPRRVRFAHPFTGEWIVYQRDCGRGSEAE